MDRDSYEVFSQRDNIHYLICGCCSGDLDMVKKYYKDVSFLNPRRLWNNFDVHVDFPFLVDFPSPVHYAFHKGHKEICEYFISQMVYDVSGGIIHKIPDNKYVQKALERFCERYEEYDENIREQIKYVLVEYKGLSLLNEFQGQYVWEVASDMQLLAQCLLDIPPISVVLECDSDKAIILEEGPRSPKMASVTMETLSGYDKYCKVTQTLQTCRPLIDGNNCFEGNTQKLFRCIDDFNCMSVAINDLSAHSTFPFHDFLSDHGRLLYYINIEALNLSKRSDYFNVRNEDDDLPLHIICRQHELGKDNNNLLLRIFSQCDVNAKNKKGETSCQIACVREDMETLKCLVVNTQCDMYHYGKTESENIEIANRLIKQVFADTHISLPSLVSLIPGDSLLHTIARIQYSEDAIEFMVHGMDINTCRLNLRKEFALHVACRTGHSCLSLQALSNCSVSQKDVDGNTPFDILVENHPMRFDLMVCVLKLPSFSIDSEHSSLELVATQHFRDVESEYLQSAYSYSNTVLHIALELKKINLVQILKNDFTNKFHKIVSSSNIVMELPFHVAGRIRDKEAISLVYNDRDPNVASDSGNTALHEACLHSVGTEKDLEAVKYLIEEVKCDPQLCNKDGNTALHLACRKGCIDIASFLLNEVKVNTNTKNKEGCTPLMLTALNYHQIIRLLIENGAETSHLYATYNMFFEKYSSKDPPPTPLNIIVAGKPSSGKTTIIEALKRDGSGETVRAEEHTAGIIPSSYDSKSIGMTAWYDLAGQSEYYASHEAVLHTIMSSSSPLILLLVDCRKPQELIQQDILYWLHFLKNQALINTTKAEPHLIVVFSFSDEVSPDRTKSTISCCEKSLTSFINKASFKVYRICSIRLS